MPHIFVSTAEMARASTFAARPALR